MSGDPEDFEDPIKSAFTPAAKLRAPDQREASIMDMMAKMQHDFQRQLQELEERQMFLQMENDTLREMTSNQPNQTNQNPTNPKTTIKTETPDQAQDQPNQNQEQSQRTKHSGCVAITGDPLYIALERILEMIILKFFLKELML